MAAYTTVARIRALDKLITFDLMPDAEVEQAIADAGVELDFRLSNKYVVPFAGVFASPPTPPKVELIARYLAAGLLLQRYYSNRIPVDDSTTEEPRSKAYLHQAELWLKHLESSPQILTDSGVVLQTDATKGVARGIFTTNPEDPDFESGLHPFRNELADHWTTGTYTN